MKPYRTLLAGVAMLLAMTTFAGNLDTVAYASGGSPVSAPGKPGPTHGSHHYWQRRDRAVYVVSTLNTAVCPTGNQLSAVLWNRDSARLFDVLQSTSQRRLYYVEARQVSGTLVGVYAYEFGWKLPQGVERAECVQPATPRVVALYSPGGVQRIAEFHSTLPR